MKRIFVLLTAMTVLVTLLGAAIVPNQTPLVEIMIVQATDAQTAATAVADHGGAVKTELAIINAVSAELTAAQVAALEADGRVVALYENGQAHTAETNAPHTGPNGGQCRFPPGDGG
jgi:hypothetical protein